METVIKTILIYVLLLALIRLAGRRTLGKITTFDLILVLIIGGTTQRALLGQDYSVINALLVVVTLIVMDVAFSLIERESPLFAKIVNGNPLIVVEDGRPFRSRLRKARLTEDDVLAAARRSHGIVRLEDVKFAILEGSGDISIVPAKP